MASSGTILGQFTAYQTLLKSYISEGLRRDEAQFDQ